MKALHLKVTVWRSIAALILAAGLAATALRITKGLGGTTHLNDQFPWGLWIGFDVLCGVGLAAGGFTLAAIVHIFNVRRFEPIVRPTILTAFLGYLLVIVGLLYDLGRPWAIWHAIIMWNPNSVMFEVAWCVMLYTTVLALEFSPVVFERLGWTWAVRVMKSLTIPVIIVGVLLSTLHQSSLGSLYLIVPTKLYGLWYTPNLPLLFFVSAVAVGCAMVIFESNLSARAFRRGLELPLLGQLAWLCVVTLSIYGAMKLVDLWNQKASWLLFVPRAETYLFWAEVSIGVLAPVALLSFRRARASRRGQFLGAVLVILGFVLNRMNITITGMEASAGRSYFPSWMEIAVTLSIVTVGFIAFAAAAKHLPVFKSEGEVAGPVEKRWSEELRLVTKTG